MHCKMFSSILGLFLLDVYRNPPLPPHFTTAKNVSRHYYMSLGPGGVGEEDGDGGIRKKGALRVTACLFFVTALFRDKKMKFRY